MTSMIRLFFFIISLLAVSLSAVAGVSLDRTRIIFKENDKNQSVNVINDSSKLYLIQSSVLTDYNDAQSDTGAPFMAIPPIARLEKESSNAVKILPQDLHLLPSDRESLFFLVVNLIPEGKKISETDDNISIKFNIATKIIIKLFYRPASVTGNIDELAGSLTFHNSNNQLIIKNTAGFYYTLEYLNLDGKPYQSESAPMIAPYSSLSLPVSDKIGKVQWRIINDFGGQSDLFNTEVNERP